MHLHLWKTPMHRPRVHSLSQWLVNKGDGCTSWSIHCKLLMYLRHISSCETKCLKLKINLPCLAIWDGRWTESDLLISLHCSTLLSAISFINLHQEYLPTASEGWGKVMFSVCPHPKGDTPVRSRWGAPQPGLMGGVGGVLWPGPIGGVPQPGPTGDGVPQPRWRGVSQPGLTGGCPSQVWWDTQGVVPRAGMGTPTRSGWVYPSCGTPWQGWGIPHQVRTRGVPKMGYPPAGMGYPPVQDSRWSTWYVTVFVPLAFTQEDCLVLS